MSTLELKSKLIYEIERSEDGEILQELYRMLETGREEIEIYPLDEAQIATVNQARQQAASGNTISHGEATIAINQWLEN
jgi:hypothetical protein